MDKEFIVLYTHQKQKKAKTWHDGVLKASCQSKKATLYDEKGSRLDSIYITAGDITLGEQLESDRYYILVEDLKKESPGTDSPLQQTQRNGLESCMSKSTKPQMSLVEKRQTAQSSQGRCSGLKRKMSGFIPPRMARETRHEPNKNTPQIHEENNSFTSQMTQKLNSRRYDSQSIEKSGAFIPNLRRDAVNSNSGKSGVCRSVSIQNSVTDNLPVINSFSSPVANYMNSLQKVCCDSQESDVNEGKVKSPWSVYGSNSSSPKIMSSPKLVESRNILQHESVSNIYTYDEIKSSGRISNKCNEDSIIGEKPGADKTNSFKMNEINVVNFRDRQNHNESRNANECEIENTASIQNPEQSKRSMLEIMNLLNKGKTSQPLNAITRKDDIKSSETTTVSFNLNPCENKFTFRDMRNTDSLDKKDEGHERATTLCNDAEETEVNKDLMESPYVSEPYSFISNQMNDPNLNSEEPSETGDLNMDAGPSFAISFSPLSNVTYSDDETDKECKHINKSILDNSSLQAVETDRLNENKDNNFTNNAFEHIPVLSDVVGEQDTDSGDTQVSRNETINVHQNEAIEHDMQCDTFYGIRKEISESVTDATGGVESLDLKRDMSKNDLTNSNEIIKIEGGKYDLKGKTLTAVHEDDLFISGNTERCSLGSYDSDNTPFGREFAKKINLDNEDIDKGDNLNEAKVLMANLEEAKVPMVNQAVKESSVVDQNPNSEQYINQEDSIDYQQENKVTKSDIKYETDIIDVIDKANDQTEYSFDQRTNSGSSDKIVCESVDKKTSQSQDTMDYNCDTLSHCSDSQNFSDSQIPVVPDLTLLQSDSKARLLSQQLSGKSDMSYQSENTSQRVPFISGTTDFSQKMPDKMLLNGALNDNRDNIQSEANQKLLQMHCSIPVMKNKSKGSDYAVCNIGHYIKRQPLNNPEANDQSSQVAMNDGDIKRPQFSCFGSFASTDSVQQGAECESILTQIDHHHRVNLNYRSLKANQLQYRHIKNTPDTITGWQSNRENLPSPQLLHPPALYDRNIKERKRKLDITADVNTWESNNIPPVLKEEAPDLHEKINEKFKGYMIHGSLCSQVSRDPHHTRVMRNAVSPCQRLSEYDGAIQNETSPSLFEDYSEEKCEIAKHGLDRLTDSPDFRVPEEGHSVSPQSSAGISAMKLRAKQCVFISDSDATSKESTPQRIFHVTGEDSDEDYIYTHIYKPRLMVQDHYPTETADKMSLSLDSQRQYPCIAVDSVETPTERSQVDGCENVNEAESSPEFFTQPRHMVHVQKAGGLQIFREKHRAALKSKPFEDDITHNSYQNFTVSRVEAVEEGGLTTSDAIGNERIASNILKNTAIGYKTSDKNSSNCKKEVDSNSWDEDSPDKTVRDIQYSENNLMNDRTSDYTNNDKFHYEKMHFSELQDQSVAGKETDSSDISLSSQEFACIGNKSLKPVDVKPLISAQNEASLSKWEKYNSQHSDDDVDLNVTPFKVKLKDFSVIEKPVKAESMAVPKNTQFGRKSLNKIDKENIISKNVVTNISALKEENLIKSSKLKTARVVSQDSKLPSSFSSMDSFEQMLANENLEFNDPELDKVLMSQANIDRIAEKHLGESAYNTAGKITTENGEVDILHKQTLTEENDNSASLSVEKIIKHDQSVSFNTIHLETEVFDSDRRLPDTVGKGSGEKNALSPELESSFSLDDSFMASNICEKNSLTAVDKDSACTLRIPWKENITLASDTIAPTSDKNDNENSVKKSTDNNIEKLVKSCDSVSSSVSDRKHVEANFMGYDSDENCTDSQHHVSPRSENFSEVGSTNKNHTVKSFANKPQSFGANYNQNHMKSSVLTKTTKQNLARNSHQTLNTAANEQNSTVHNSQFKNPFNGSNMPQQRNIGQSTQLNKRFKPPTLGKGHMVLPGRQECSPSVPRGKLNSIPAGDLQADVFSSSMCGELLFPSRALVQSSGTLLRQVAIPTRFKSASEYKNILIAAVKEYLNLQLCDLAKKYHHALSKVDTSQLQGSQQVSVSESNAKTPRCQCGAAAKVVQVKKQGPNNGRFFYVCSADRNQQCKFFQWLDGADRGTYAGGRRKISDPCSLISHMKSQRVQYYSPCSLVSKYRENIKDHFKQKYARRDAGSMQKKQMYLKLSHRGQSSLYSKDDIWVISQSLDFNSQCTFIARSTYFGPTSSNEVEIDPIIGYSPSNWGKEVVCHALLAGNASSELSCLDNIREHITAQTPVVLASLLNRVMETSIPTSGFQVPRIVTESNRSRNIFVHSEDIDELVQAYIEDYHLNEDQAEAIKRVGSMFSVEKSDTSDSVLLIHGVFGAGKSFLLSVIVLFLVKVFQRNDLSSPREPFPWKLLISSTTNVAVDRILLGLLELGFEDFIRVGSVKKVAKPILPYSVHAAGSDSQELKDFQEMLRSGELTSAEKQSVRQGIDNLRKGENKKKLAGVRVVGVTCASCLAACIANIQFPVVLLDECSQMTEPSSLLPIARFGCQKLLLVGDPKQLDPTIQGSDAASENGLEQTMFDRLIKMGYLPTLLRTQYRCHPDISAVANKLFYSGMLIDGVSAEQRSPLLPELPTICLYDVDRGHECCEMAGSYYNEQEAQFVVFLILFLMSCDIEPSSVGVITLYKSQMARITDMLNTGIAGENKEIKGVQVSTVDAFQGGERDVIILSTVRTQATGFIDNDKRINVALTRARHHLLIVGNYSNLSRNLLWEKSLNHVRGFPNGIQSADEARHELESVLEKLKQERCDQIKSSNSSESPQDSEKKAPRKPATKRKWKKDESPTSSGSSGRKEPQSQQKSSSVKRKRNLADTESPQFSLSYSSDGGLPASTPLHADVEENLETRTSREHKKSRFSDRLKVDMFGSVDNEDSSDEDLIAFSM